MNVEKIFNNTKMFNKIKMDTILVEDKYPVLFTCRDKNDTYLFICCFVNSKVIKWIGTKIKCETLIELLKNEITIRAAFAGNYDEKLLIEYSELEENTSVKKVHPNMIPENYLPTGASYMDAEEGEFEEEIRIFSSRI